METKVVNEMECVPFSLGLENSEEKTMTSNKDDERLEEAKQDDIHSNLGTKPWTSERRKDNSVKLTSSIVSIEKLKEDYVITEKQMRTSKEPEEISAIKIPDQNPPLKESKLKPGVILLGRGNSFSLGRSEVILLHNRPVRKGKEEVKRVPGESDLASIQEQSNTPPSPPPISKTDVSSKMNVHTNGWDRREKDSSQEEVENVGDDGDADTDAFAKSLRQLWRKAEEVMTAREGRVMKVLEEFGIGELGGGGGDHGGEGMQEEEQVWQIVQENYRSQR